MCIRKLSQRQEIRRDICVHSLGERRNSSEVESVAVATAPMEANKTKKVNCIIEGTKRSNRTQ